ncbi:MAG: TonB family protein [Pseudohongiellaceae bacterium]|jgi:TonB family protein
MRVLFVVGIAIFLSSCMTGTNTDVSSSHVRDCAGNIVSDVLSRELTLCTARAPFYPREAHSKGIEGACVTTFDVGLNGRISNPSVVCKPEGFFERATLESKKYFRYLPKIENGIPVVSRGVSRNDVFEL